MEKPLEFVSNHPYLFLLLFTILILLFVNLYSDILSKIKLITPTEAIRLINHDDVKVVDIRTQADFEKGHIIDSINIAIAQLAKNTKKLEKHKDKGVIVCCSNGVLSNKEANNLMNNGFEKVYCLKGGIIAWQNAKLPLTKS